MNIIIIITIYLEGVEINHGSFLIERKEKMSPLPVLERYERETKVASKSFVVVFDREERRVRRSVEYVAW